MQTLLQHHQKETAARPRRSTPAMTSCTMGPLTTITPFDAESWTEPSSGNAARSAVESLEQGDVLFFPALSFAIDADEAELFSPAILSSAKNASFDPVSNRVGGTTVQGVGLERLRGLMARFSDHADTFVRGVLTPYDGH